MAEPSDGKRLQAITVILPVFNGENFLAETLESVLAQSHPAAEVLVINDGSTDATASIAAAFGDRIRLIDRLNAGVSESRNYALAVASTEWVALVDHDDLWEPNHLANIAQAIAREPGADVCYTGARWMVRDAAGSFQTTEPLSFPSEAEIEAALMDRCAFITSSVALRREKVLALGGFDQRYTNYEDWDLWLRLLRSGAKFVCSPEPTLLYRVHPVSATHNPIPGLLQSREIVKRNILPRLSPVGRATAGRRVLSRLESEAAILLRENGMPGALPLLLRSIARYPFHDARRYRVVLHLLMHGYPRK